MGTAQSETQERELGLLLTSPPPEATEEPLSSALLTEPDW